MYENIYPDRGMSVNGDGGRAGVFLVSHESPSPRLLTLIL